MRLWMSQTAVVPATFCQQWIIAALALCWHCVCVCPALNVGAACTLGVQSNTNVKGGWSPVHVRVQVATWQSSHPSGLEVFYFPSGQVEGHHPGGSKDIVFPDGSIRRVLPDG
jgi:hypothetical protein